jgi:hypothetical protein
MENTKGDCMAIKVHEKTPGYNSWKEWYVVMSVKGKLG